MTPGAIRDANFVYGAPPGVPNCSDLHVRVTQDEGIRIMTSAWFPTQDEIVRMLEGQPVWLHVYGGQHPVVAITVPED